MAELLYTPLRQDANIVSYYRMEGNGNDDLGTNNGTASNVTFNTSNGKYVQGGGFNGTSSVVTVADSASLKITGNLTICGWINLTSTAGTQMIFEKGNSDSIANQDYVLAISGGVVVGVVSNGTTNKEADGATSLSTGTWYHVALVFVPSTSVTVYLNGKQDGQNTTSIIASIQSTTHAAAIGRDGSASSRWFSGAIDDLAIFSRALSQAELLQLIANRGLSASGGGGQ